MTYFVLFFRFFFMGLFAIGGGFAIIPFLEKLVVETSEISQNELMNIIAFAEMTPGAIGVNMATYTGFMVKGILGGIIATLGLVFPSLFIVFFMNRIWLKAKNVLVVTSIFNAVKIAVIGLLFSVFLSIFMLVFQKDDIFEFNAFKLFLFIILLLLSLSFKLNPISYIIGMAFVGILTEL